MTRKLPDRWPRKPPGDARCDGSTSWATDQHGKPIVYRCARSATETCWVLVGVLPETWLCEPCAVSMAERGIVARNPRRRL